MISVIVISTIIVLIILDAAKVLTVTNTIAASIGLFLLAHIVGFAALSTQPEIAIIPEGQFYFILIPLIFFTIYLGIRLHMYVTPEPPTVKMGLRTRIMMGGREIILLSLFNSILQIPFTIFLVKLFSHYTIPKTVIVTDIVLTIIMLFALAFNGVIRIFATSKHLRVLHRIIIFLFMWIPVINFYIAFKYCKIIKNEYGIELYREELHATREESQVCKTKYPLLLLHGIGFRDPKYASYWGRIPKWLKRNGAVIYYGEQHAWGTMENNAEEIKNKIRTIMEETGSEKINIIAHSKGGLDARYLISSLEMAKHVASLTTISTPHRGSELIDVLEKLGEKKYRQVTASIDKYFKFFGDSVPDSYTSSKQLKPSYMEKFNEENPDSPLVYYQSYGDAMSQANSDGLLSGPYLLMKWAKGESDGNDGLVSLESAKWGEFRGLFSSEDGKGLSHGDVIDLKRKDMDGSDVIEKYIEIVSELKEKGY